MDLERFSNWLKHLSSIADKRLVLAVAFPRGGDVGGYELLLLEGFDAAGADVADEGEGGCGGVEGGGGGRVWGEGEEGVIAGEDCAGAAFAAAAVD